MTSRRKIAGWCGGAALVGCGLLAIHPLRHAASGRDWLLASRPTFALETNRGNAKPVIRFAVSNAGPAAVQFYLAWSECIPGPERGPLEMVPRLPARLVLSPRATTTVVLDLTEPYTTAIEPAFTCQLIWMESDSMSHRLTRALDGPMCALGDLLGFDWRELFPLAKGGLFPSNRTADFHSLQRFYIIPGAPTNGAAMR